ncbi:rhomboid family intramembrane serine protease [Symbiobacterium thermophilum]|uniref:Conserved domain protein n=1 Tax=Symbiobacterium thermophilum (strain DSM 24528 / JCM 14929 / IAM 14863 / T) TaxID=292459 RepID=Q67N90_SYMTH|nr:rhomboid family intramembrane serine protease [Symbiobacterium thermophilum]BAD40853.1 conserved domain protein [Symbiobacterium thermophilum IAM 14863]
MNYSAYVESVGSQLADRGFEVQAVPPELQGRLALLVSRQEEWGRLLLALAAELNPSDPQERESLAQACGAWVREARGDEVWHMILLFPFDRTVGEEEAEAIAALEERDPGERWGVIPWSADLAVGLLDQHTGFPPVDEAVARILTDVPETPERRFVEVRPRYEARRPWPGLDRFPATRLILALTVAYYLWTVWMGGGLLNLISGPDTLSLVIWGANYSLLTLAERTQQWRLVSHLFLHGGAMHLAFNMWAFWQVGRYCELIYGSARMLFIYFVAGVIGGVASVAVRPGLVISVGASGAILGLMGALIYFATTVRNRRVDWQGLLAPVAINLLFGFVYGRVDNYAHIGGLLGGLLAAFVAGVPGERGGWRQLAAPALGVLVGLVVAGVLPLKHVSTLLP